MDAEDKTTDYDGNAALAALVWQAELGVTEVVGDTPVDAYALPEKLAKPAPPQPEPESAPPVSRKRTPPEHSPAPAAAGPDPVEVSTQAASVAEDLSALRAAMEAFDLCDLKKGARKFVFADGQPGAHLMIVGEAPGREEDLAGFPFVGQAGQLLDRMLAAIGLSRKAEEIAQAVYITNTLPWRPPGNRDPSPEEIAMMRPFLMRHIFLARPKVLIAAGNTACSALLGQRGILRLRGNWKDCGGLPLMPMTHPSYLLRNPAAKREAWADLLDIRARLEELA
ncbi:MAG: uracil-DNA glycosylase family protein [Pseudorhodobacter sp.]